MHDDHEQLGADERRAEVSAILAAAVLRLHDRHRLAPHSLPQIPPESCQNRLDVPLEQSVHGDRRVNTGENHREEHEL